MLPSCLVSFCLVSTHPAQAQDPGGSWTVMQCDAQGNPASSIVGTETGQATNTYPTPMIPGGGYFINGFYPGFVSSMPLSTTFYDDTIGVDPPASSVDAGNSYNTGYGESGTYYGTDSSGNSVTGPINGSVSANWSGQITAYYKEVWQGWGAPTTPMPDHIDFLLNTEVCASAGVNYGSSKQSSGLSATSTSSDGDPFNETASASAGDAGAGSGPQTVTGHHLVRASVDSGTGIAEVYLNGTTNWTASNQVPYMVPSSGGSAPTFNGSTDASASGYVNVGIQQDSREVMITSKPDIETSYYKGYDPNSGTTLKLENQRNPNGSITTDSAVSPPLTQPGAPTTSWTASPGMLGVASGFQNPVFAWSLKGEGSLSASGNTSHTQLSVQFPVSSTDTSLNKQSTVRLDVTDSDGASGANTFTVRWHYPYENWETSGAQFQNSPIAFPSTGPARVGGQVTIPVTSAASGVTLNMAGKVVGGILTTGAATVAIAAPETDPLIIAFATATGYTLSVLDAPPTPQPYTETGTPAQFQQDVATQEAINNGNTSGIFLPSRPRMDPSLAAQIYADGNYSSYTSDTGGQLGFDCTAYAEQMQQNYVGDDYNQNGYTGPVAGSVTFPGPWMYVWTWTWAPTTPPNN